MAAVTAVIMVGNGHPNDSGVDPFVLLKLWEGDRAVWTGHRLDGVPDELRVSPSEPSQIAKAGCELALKVAKQHDCDSVWVTVMKGSTLHSQLSECGSLLTDVDIFICQESGSRSYSHWKNAWVEDGILK